MPRSRRPVLASSRPVDAVQAHLALSHGSVSWHAFPLSVRERVVSLWIDLLRGHADAASTEAPTP
ncbi:hypothetical protein [Gemmatimonas sp.]|jgi:hypothetical protein|uniref:hypothetical protein n=1 Tax=Gemmatimonas sp. TaxID=1962908 RepID=UPI0025BCBD04|nr:hypothetical protein [Gemmatimonas sp.]MCA2985523.1 hypothetical protein [Gemmatimonas sp.]MCA2989838.1 hypothetical protein [Gemmatimonas sp.]MCU0618055.1 hypothetical protein [Gemmatimonadaceae bacterium]